MTQPDIDGPPVPDEESLAFEALVVATVTGTLATLVNATVGSLLAAHAAATKVGALSTIGAGVLGRAAASRLRQIIWPPMVPALQAAAGEARDLGQTRAVRRLPPEQREEGAAVSWHRGGGVPAVPDIDAAAREKLDEAARLALTLDMRWKASVDAVAGRARSSVADAQGGARWVANEGINVGTATVAQALGYHLIWVSERGACLHCLAHAGWVVAPGDAFPAVSFDPLAKGVQRVNWPPLHPNCRCQVRTYDGPAGEPGTDRSAPDPASRLAAEARRSVVYQWSDSASGVAAQRAAGALLTAGADLPASVESRARRALRTGHEVKRPR